MSSVKPATDEQKEDKKSKQNQKAKDIEILSLDSLRWDPDSREASLASIVESLADKASEASKWYLEKKQKKKQRAIWLRAGAIIITTLAAVLPILTQMNVTLLGAAKPIPAALASVLLALAAMLIGLDQFGGFSSAWMRYMGTDLKIKGLHTDFQMDYQAERAAWKGQKPTDEQTKQVLEMAKTFITAINAVIQDETTAWIQEFKSNLTRIDDSAKAASTTLAVGSINLTVENGDQCSNGWNLSVDNGRPILKRGKTAAIPNVFPGQHKIKVEEAAPGKKSGEVMVNVVTGTTVSATMTLA